MNNKEVLEKAKVALEKSRKSFVEYVENVFNPISEEGKEDEIAAVTLERDRLFHQTEYWGVIVRALIAYTERATPVTQDFIDSFQYLKRVQIITMFRELTEELKTINQNIYIRSYSGLYADENVFFGEICLGNVQGFTETILKPNDTIIKTIENYFSKRNIKITFNDIKNCFVLRNVVIDLHTIN